MRAGLLRVFEPHGKVAKSFVRRMATATAGKHLRILIVDGYSAEKAQGFESLGMPQASLLYEQMLRRQLPAGVTMECVRVSPCLDGFQMPDDSFIQRFDGCAFTGSSYSVYEEVDDVKKQIDLFRRTVSCGVSLFGSCWGLQVAAVGLGGTVELNCNGREVGPGRGISLTREGRAHAMYQGKKSVFEHYESHSDEVTRLPVGAMVLASNDWTRVQAMGVVVKGVESWFVQYHPEYNIQYYADLINSREERMIGMGFFATPKDSQRYCSELRELHNNPKRKDLAWKYGISQDMINTDISQAEVLNWIRYLLARR